LIKNILNEEYETNAWVYSYIIGGERFAMDGFFPHGWHQFSLGVNFKF
jgi:iron complex outermembrane receptor protein